MFECNVVLQLEDIQVVVCVQDVQSKFLVNDVMILCLKVVIVELQVKMGEVLLCFCLDVCVEFIVVEIELVCLQEEIKLCNDCVLCLEVKVFMDGVVNCVMINIVGGVVWFGDFIIEMIFSDDKLVIEVCIFLIDCVELVIGVKVCVKVLVYDYGVYGVMEGVVIEISVDIVFDENNSCGECSYCIKIVVQCGDNELQCKLVLMFGMIVSVDIIVGCCMVWQYLMLLLLCFGQGVLWEL